MGRVLFVHQDDAAYNPYNPGSYISTWIELLLKDFRAIPFVIVWVSLTWQAAHLLATILFPARRGMRVEENDEVWFSESQQKLKKHVAFLGGHTIVAFMLARLLGSVSLLMLSKRIFGSTCRSLSFEECPELFLTSAFLYSTIMGVVAIVSKRWHFSATRFNIITLFSTFLVYMYRDIWPLATYTEQPADIQEGITLWVKIGILAVVAVFIPLGIPRRYVPVDPQNPMASPNPEQIASIFSFLTYTFLDKVIFLGHKVAHLRFDQLPPLADYDTARYQTEKSFRHLDVYSGAPQRHLFFRLMRVYWKEYMILAITIIIYTLAGFASPIGIYKILRYLETGGTEENVKPWLWIVWLFFGPMLRSTCWQFYQYFATRVLALTEILMTQLVFEHSLRVRFKAETSNSQKEQSATGEPSRAESLVGSEIAEQPSEGVGQADVAGSIAESTSESPAASSEASTDTVRDASASTEASDATGKAKTDQNSAQQPKEEAKNEQEDDENLVGKINNLITNDLGSIVAASDFLALIVGVPLNIGLCLVFLYRLLGWSTFVGFGTMIALLPVPGLLVNKMQETINAKMKMSDARIQAVSETVNVIRMVKLFGWEKRTAERLQEKRELELKLMWRTRLLNCASQMISFIVPTITTVTTYGLYTIVMKQELTPSILFSSIAVLSVMAEEISHITIAAITLVQGKVSLDRLDKFFRSTELLDSFLKDAQNVPSLLITSALIVEPTDQIGFRNATFAWSIDKEKDSTLATPFSRIFKLRIEGDLLFKRNAINMIVGPTGSGKTSILMALLGEMHFISTAPDSWFNLPRQGGIAYAAQESWVQNDTIRNNVLFGSEYDEERYKKVIRQCALQQDLDMFDAGDATEVGERGLTLSGGQKARVTLARAIYSPAEIILLDDVLAALDVHTSSWIVDNCFRGDLIKDRTILIVTHNVALVSPVSDFIVSIGTDGKIKSRGNQISVAASRDSKLAAELKVDEEITALGEEVIDDSPEGGKAQGSGKLTVAEDIAQGHVTWKSFKLLLKSMGGRYPIIFFSVVIAAFQLDFWAHNFQLWFIGYWGSQYESRPASEVPVYLYLSGYTGITLLICVFFSTSYMVFMSGSMRASRVINALLIESILGSTLRWLDETPVGRIIARCTKDISTLDGPLSYNLLWVMDSVSGVLAHLGGIILFSPIFIFPGLGIGFVGVWLASMYLKAQLSVTRETSNARAPMLSHFGAAIHGLTSIRAYGAQDRFKAELQTRINHYTRVARMSHNLTRWVGLRMDLLGAVFTSALAVYLVYGPRVGTANTGFSLNMALEFTGGILMFVRVYNGFEVQANSVERIQGYLDIEHEPQPTEKGKPPAAWPTSGDLRVENLCARYSKTGPQVLHNLSFHIASGERVGVVGRTGSGKSSLTLALLRCILTEGEVYLDGMPTSTVNLDALRTSITIIPQTPELLSGSLRENLDPFAQNDDAVLNAALAAAGLSALQADAAVEARLALDTPIASGGANLSVGQRQILALARAMVRGSKLLILDEATSAIDYKTDAIIQNTLRTQLVRDVTVITVAHRLQTIMDADKIMVLDDGRIAEFGKPADLLKNKNGMLRALVHESSDKEKLYELAGGQ